MSAFPFFLSHSLSLYLCACLLVCIWMCVTLSILKLEEPNSLAKGHNFDGEKSQFHVSDGNGDDKDVSRQTTLRAKPGHLLWRTDLSCFQQTTVPLCWAQMKNRSGGALLLPTLSEPPSVLLHEFCAEHNPRPITPCVGIARQSVVLISSSSVLLEITTVPRCF